MNAQVSLEVSFDPPSVSNASATWIDVTNFLLGADWQDGIETDGDSPQAAIAHLLLDNRDRRFEPEFSGILTNLMDRPSFEDGAIPPAGWTKTDANSSVTATSDTGTVKFGGRSLKLVNANAGEDDYYSRSITVGVGNVVTVSAWVSVTSFTSGALSNRGLFILDSGGGSNTATITATTAGFVRLSVSRTMVGSSIGVRLYSPQATVFWDGVQVEIGSLTDYIDGAQDNGRWSGTAHASSSYRGGPYYPNVIQNKRFRLKVRDGIGSGTFYDHGIWYVQNWNVDFGDGFWETVNVECNDGMAILSGDDLPTLDPPDAETISDVYEADNPSFQYGFDEPAGTKVITTVRKIKRKKKGQKKVHVTKLRKRHVVTRSEVEGISGPSGTYKNTPTLQEPSGLLGDAGYSVRFEDANDEYAVIPLDVADLISTNQLTIDLWAKVATTPGSSFQNGILVSGPGNDTISAHVWGLYLLSVSSVINIGFELQFTSGGSVAILAPVPGWALNTWFNFTATWDTGVGVIYVNGTEIKRQSALGILRAGTAASASIWWATDRYRGQGLDGWLDLGAIYETPLDASRVSAHYIAGTARGWPSQLVGARILDIVTHGLWAETKIQNGAFTLIPAMKHGQSRLDEIEDLVATENGLFFFDGVGDPVYLGWEYKGASPYNTPQATFGNQSGEVPYEDVDMDYDNLIYNEISVAGASGVPQISTDATSQTNVGRKNLPPIEFDLQYDSDALEASQALLASWKDPQYIVKSIDLSATDPTARTQLLSRKIGEPIRVKNRPRGGSGKVIDLVANIIGRKFLLPVETGELKGTFFLSRGFNAGNGLWQAGIVGFSEAGNTTVAG